MKVDEYYSKARKQAKKSYSSSISKGENGFLPSLDGMLKNVDIVTHQYLGNMEIPLKKVIGTYTHNRSLSFAKNFMPLQDEDSEFAIKWQSLCNAHLTEGINESIKVYEYLNWFYVIEGNKRVSVLKYFGGYSISANVTRLIPKKDEEDITNKIYYEFLKFYRHTKINSIWFSAPGKFRKLLRLLENFNPELKYIEDKYKHFETYVYIPFRNKYLQYDDQKLPITTGDAYLEYAKIYGVNEIEEAEKLSDNFKTFYSELENMIKNPSMDIQTSHEDADTENTVIFKLSNLIKSTKKVKVAFLYARTIEGSGWTYGHELGRKYVDEVLGDKVITKGFENVPEDDLAYDKIKEIIDDGYSIIFTTSPIFKNATLKCALEYPNVKFFNCSEYSPYKHLNNYFGRTYEPRFLTGIIAGALTKNNIIGYAATSPTPEVIASINAFTLGVNMVNPEATVHVAWTKEWNSHNKFAHADRLLIQNGADIISNRNLAVPRDVTNKYGVYSMLCSIKPGTEKSQKYLAAPIWRWGIFYEKIINAVLNDSSKTFSELLSNDNKTINFWWGMASEVIDIYYSKEFVPEETQKLLELLTKLIKNGDFHPFTGPVYDRNNNLRIMKDEIPLPEDILTMNWFVKNVHLESYV